MNTLWVRQYIRDLAEAAFPLDVSKRKLRELQLPISQHLFKAFYLKDDLAVQHWRSELSGWAVTLARLNNTKTKSGRAFSYELLYQILWDEPFGTEEDLRTLARLFGVPAKLVLDRKREFEIFVVTFIGAITSCSRWV